MLASELENALRAVGMNVINMCLEVETEDSIRFSGETSGGASVSIEIPKGQGEYWWIWALGTSATRRTLAETVAALKVLTLRRITKLQNEHERTFK